MQSHRALLAMALLICGLFTSCASMKGGGKPLNKPNILFIAIDDLRPELGCYGDTQAITPCIDKLAAEGVVFRRAYCQVPVCGASRASLMTGILPTKQRFVSYNTWAEKDVPGAVTLPQVFKEAGYTTLSNGKIFHHGTDTQARSWSEPAWHPEGMSHMSSFDPATTEKLSDRERGRIFEFPDVADGAYGDGKVAEKTIQDLRRLKRSGKPFFLACGFIRPHLPFYAPKRYWDLYDRDMLDLADNRFRPENAPKALRGSGEFNSYHLADYKVNSDAWHRMMLHGYLACTSYADKLAGNVLAELERLGLAENTIVVIWGDHGWHLGEHNFWGKHNTLHNALRVPLIVKVPGKSTAGKTEALVESVDIFPTLCSLANLPIPASVHGRSFESLLDDPEQAFRESVYTRFKAADAIVTENFVYSSYENEEEMLYDHRTDPQEDRNVVEDPSYRAVLRDLKSLLKGRMQEARVIAN